MKNIFAAIDLGSNSFHMIVARHEDGQMIILDRLREMVRLASGLDENNNINDEVMSRALSCLSRFGERISHLHADVVRIVGTNTLRKAHNSKIFMRKAQELLGHPIEIISGIEEARLIYSGVSHNVDMNDDKRLVVDIGGGSTEIIIGERYNPITLESLYMGCVNTTVKFFKDGKISQKRIDKAYAMAMTELEPIMQLYKQIGWKYAIGASGTIKSLRDIANEEGWSNNAVTRKSLNKTLSRIAEADKIENISLQGLSPERVAVITGGTIVLSAIFEALDLKEMTVSDGALREGMLYDLAGRVENHDVRSESVNSFAERFVLDIAHGQRVAKTAQALCKQLQKTWLKGLPEAGQFLHWAALLHEVGLSIAHNQHHKHGAYMISHADMMGFSRQDQELLATLVLEQRRKLNISALNELDSGEKKTAERATILLRLSVLMNRSRVDEAIAIPDIEISKKQITLKFDQQWLLDHPLTYSDLRNEMEFLENAGYQLNVESV